VLQLINQNCWKAQQGLGVVLADGETKKASQSVIEACSRWKRGSLFQGIYQRAKGADIRRIIVNGKDSMRWGDTGAEGGVSILTCIAEESHNYLIEVREEKTGRF